MLVINYKGITPQQRFYSIGVKGNDKANEIKFIVERYQNDLDLASLTPYLKVSNKCEYFDKIALTLTSDDDFIYLVWTMTRKSTQFRNLELQLQFQSNDSNDIVFQTIIAELELNGTIKADEEISKKHPTIIEQLIKIVKELEPTAEKITSMSYTNDILTLIISNAKGETRILEVTIPTSDRVIETNFDSSVSVEEVFEVVGNKTCCQVFANMNFYRITKRANGNYNLIFWGHNGYRIALNVVGNTNFDTVYHDVADFVEYITTDSIDDYIGGKLDKVSNPNKIYGTDENGDQTTYNERDFAKLIGMLPRIILDDDLILPIFTKYDGQYLVIEDVSAEETYLGTVWTSTGGNKGGLNLISLYDWSIYEGTNITLADKTLADALEVCHRHPIETTDYKTTSLSGSSTDREYPSAKAVWDLVQAIKRNAFTPVDIETYPTLADFLASTGEEGYLYLYPVDTSDLTKGYKQYIWENSAWVYMGDTQLDLTNYPRKDQDETITGNWTWGGDNTFNGRTLFNGGIEVEGLIVYDLIELQGTNHSVVDITYNNGTLDFQDDVNGSFLKISADGVINKNSNGYGLTIPDTTSWTADKEIATTDQVVVKANESVISDQYDSTKTYAVGDIVIYNNVLYKCNTNGTTGVWDSSKWDATTVAELVADETIVRTNTNQEIVGEKTFNLPLKFKFGNSIYKIDDGQFGQLFIGNQNGYGIRIDGNTLRITNLAIGNKNFPTLPSDTTKNYRLEYVGGQMVWVEY